MVGMGFHSLGFRTALDGSDPLGVGCLAHAEGLNTRGVTEKRLSSNSCLRVCMQCLLESLYLRKLAGNSLTPAGTEMLVTTFTDIDGCTFRDRQIARKLFNCRRKSVYPVLTKA